jgi:transcriptional regulator with XRE-family HTH domain
MMRRSDSERLAAFGAALRKARLSLGLSQEELAASCGLDRTYIGGVERGERNLSLLNIWRIAAALKIHPSELFKESNK